jgi:hypothetical protein
MSGNSRAKTAGHRLKSLNNASSFKAQLRTHSGYLMERKGENELLQVGPEFFLVTQSYP